MFIFKSHNLMVRLLSAVIAAAMLCGCHYNKSNISKNLEYTQSNSGFTFDDDFSGPMGEALATEARRWLGTVYRYGGSTHAGTDCSGLVMSIYRDVCAVKLPRTTQEQHNFCKPLKRSQAKVGDLIFFGSSSKSKTVSHVGLYIGHGEMIHASSSQGVVISGIDSGYWGARFKGAGRVSGAALSWASLGKAAKPNGKQNNTKKQPAHVKADKEKATPTIPATEINLLDLIIDSKVDSIFSDRFMD